MAAPYIRDRLIAYTKATYDASGNKLSKTVKTGATVNSIQDYVMGVEYNKLGTAARKIESVYHSEGRYFNTSTTSTPSWRTEYSIKDHLGNSRISFTDKNLNGKIDVDNTVNNEILQENHYYAFGMTYDGPWQMNDAAKDNYYMYNSKELNIDHGINWSDYGARWYDACVGRWSSVDPLAEIASDWTPYRYGLNNPLSYTDPTGMSESAISKTVVNPEGTVIYHKKDDDNNIYYSSDGIEGRNGDVSGLSVLGKEKSGDNYRAGECLTWGHLSERGQQIYLEDGLDVNSMSEEWEGVFDMADYGMAFSGFSSGRPFRSNVPRRTNIKLPIVSRKFNLNDPKTFERGTPKEIIEYLKKQGWEIIPARQGKNGFRAINPKNPSDVIHIIQGNADKLKSGTNIMTVKQGDYLKRPALNWDRIPLK